MLASSIPSAFKAASYDPVSAGRYFDPASDSPAPLVKKYLCGTRFPTIAN